LEFRSVEHAYQAARTPVLAERLKIQHVAAPGIAKRMGRRVTPRLDWAEVKVGIMRDLLHQKFTQVTLHNLLLSTGDAELVEGNTWDDTFWGVCNGVGQNHLGKLIMEIRAEARAAPSAKVVTW
jgi:ribA/ribD-fused uncharacterized protein